MLNAPDFWSYGENDYTWTASDYWYDEYIGGGPVLKDFQIGWDGDYRVESPLKETAYDYKDLLEEKYDTGQKHGGYYQIHRIAKGPPADGDAYGTFYDVWVLTKPLSQNAHAKLQAENDTSSAKYWED